MCAREHAAGCVLQSNLCKRARATKQAWLWAYACVQTGELADVCFVCKQE